MGETNFKELERTYESSIERQLGAMQTNMKEMSEQLLEVKLILVSHDLPELKTKVNRHDTLLTRYDPEKISIKVEKHEIWITRMSAIIVFVQIAVGLVLAILNYWKNG
jgi:hypothetical protein